MRVLTGIGIGTFVATLARSATQAQSDAVLREPTVDGTLWRVHADRSDAKVDAAVCLNPIAHFAGLARAVLVRGSGIDVVYVQLLALGVIASVLIGVQRVEVPGADELGVGAIFAGFRNSPANVAWYRGS